MAVAGASEPVRRPLRARSPAGPGPAIGPAPASQPGPDRGPQPTQETDPNDDPNRGGHGRNEAHIHGWFSVKMDGPGRSWTVGLGLPSRGLPVRIRSPA